MRRINADFIGIGASIACAVHCAVLPLFLTGLSLFGVNIIHNFWFESGMIALAILIGTLSLQHGFRQHHRRFLPFLLFGGGVLFLIFKQFLLEFELILLPFALFLIISAHLFNYRYTRIFLRKEQMLAEAGVKKTALG